MYNTVSPNINNDQLLPSSSIRFIAAIQVLRPKAAIYHFRYVASSKQYLKDKGKWITDPGTAISINCKTKFTRPVKDEGVNRIRCQKAGGFTPAASTAHKCKRKSRGFDFPSEQAIKISCYIYIDSN